MKDLRHVIEQFGLATGIGGLHPGPDGAVRITLQGGEQIGLEAQHDTLVVSQVFAVPHATRMQLLTALQLADARQLAGMPALQLGLFGRGAEMRLLLASRLPASQADPGVIAQTLAAMRNWFLRWRAAST